MQMKQKNKPDTLRLEEVLPDGLVVNRKWLQAKGYTRSTIDYYIRSGKLENVGRGVYRRPGPPLKWEHVCYSLQELGYTLHIGGQSALDLQGFAHYLAIGRKGKAITLFGQDKLPAWVNRVSDTIQFAAFSQKTFSKLPENSLTTHTFGHWDWELKVSTVELALFELLSQVKDESDFLVADKYFESATILRPELVNTLLHACTHVQTKRLFMWFADKHAHQWSRNIHRDNIDLGSGKRVIVKGGTLDKKYNITVPREMTYNEALFF
jgi:hypothetical protein